MTVYPTLEDAAKAYGKMHQVKGGPGGWLLHEKEGQQVSLGVQGWQSYGRLLVQSNRIEVLDEARIRIDRVKTRHGVTVISYATWRRRAQGFRIRQVVTVPEAVVVDNRDGKTFRSGDDGELFTLQGARDFAARRNYSVKPGEHAYAVYRLELPGD